MQGGDHGEWGRFWCLDWRVLFRWTRSALLGRDRRLFELGRSFLMSLTDSLIPLYDSHSGKASCVRMTLGRLSVIASGPSLESPNCAIALIHADPTVTSRLRLP
jgi:hypothetical protein